MPAKPVVFLGDSLKRIRDFPVDPRRDAGYQLDRIQHGLPPDDFKALPALGPGIEEFRVWDAQGTYRVIYVARFKEAVYVLHAFQKKTQKTSRFDLDIAAQRFRLLKRVSQ